MNNNQKKMSLDTINTGFASSAFRDQTSILQGIHTNGTTRKYVHRNSLIIKGPTLILKDRLMTTRIDNRIGLSQKVQKYTDSKLDEHISDQFNARYGDQPKDLQVSVVWELARGRDVCLLAGTGYGKTRIAESFRMLFKQSLKAIVLVLNPLDALGDNQVEWTFITFFTFKDLYEWTLT